MAIDHLFAEGYSQVLMRQLIQVGLLLLSISACAAPVSQSVIWYTYQDTQTGKSGIATLDPMVKRERILYTAPSGHGIVSASLSPLGNRIGFTLRNSEDERSIWVTNADGSEPRKISDDFFNAGFFWLNNDQVVRMIVSEPDYHINLRDGHVSLFDLTSGEITPLTANDLSLSCYADGLSVRQFGWPITDIAGSFLAIGHPEVHDSELQMVRDHDITRPNDLGSMGGCASWTDNQEQIAFDFWRGQVSDYYFSEDGGKTIQRITDLGKDYDDAFVSFPALSPNGKLLIFQARLDQPRSPLVPIGTQLALAKTDGSLLTFLGQWGAIDAQLYWSPDSRFVATNQVPRIGDYPLGEIYLIDTENGGFIQLTSDGHAKNIFDWR